MGGPRSRLRCALPFAVGAGLLAWGGRARAADPPLSLLWVAPPSCPSEADLLAELRAAIGHGSGDAVHASAVVKRDGDRWRADVELSVGAASSARSVSGETCRAVADAVVVIVAIAVNPAGDPPPLANSPPPPGRRRSGGDVQAGASFLVDRGTVPSATPGVELRVGWRLLRVEVELAGSWLASETGTLPLRPKQGVRVSDGEVRLRGCVDLLAHREVFALSPCLGAGPAWLMASGFGATQKSLDATDSVTVTSFGARASIDLGRYATAVVSGEALVPLTRPIFVIDNAAPVFRSSPASARGTIGLSVHF